MIASWLSENLGQIREASLQGLERTDLRILALPGALMSPTHDHPELSAAEWKLIQDLRTLPDDALRTRVQTSLTELLYFFLTPKCQGIGVEGFPCGEPRSSCEDCHQIWDALDKVAARCRKA
jgi:hypothetical protein